MSKPLIRWRTVSREDLLDILLGEDFPNQKMEIELHEDNVKKGMIALGYTDVTFDISDQPIMIVIEDKNLNEILSWLRIYAGEAVPLSQYSRVVLLSDFKALDVGMSESLTNPKSTSRWACVAVGETLAQSDGEADLNNMALSRISSSFTLPIARTSIKFGPGQLTRICVERLKIIGTDQRFGRKAISIEQLLAAWAITGTDVEIGMSAEESAYLVLNAVETNFGVSDSKAMLKLKDFPNLLSDSIEKRVIAFNELSAIILEKHLINQTDYLPSLLAAAAFLVGRGTSHVALLKRLSKFAPTALIWFGVMAALAGPRTWDAGWLRAVKGAERLIRPSLGWTESMVADISWPEFIWIKNTFDGIEQFVSLPKMLPRTLGVEILPGIVLHVRLGGGIVENENRQTNGPSIREQELQNALNQFIELANKLRSVTANPNLSAGQQSFDLKIQSESKPKPKRSRSTKRKPDSN